MAGLMNLFIVMAFLATLFTMRQTMLVPLERAFGLMHDLQLSAHDIYCFSVLPMLKMFKCKSVHM